MLEQLQSSGEGGSQDLQAAPVDSRCPTAPLAGPAHLAVDSLALARPCCRRSLNDFMVRQSAASGRKLVLGGSRCGGGGGWERPGRPGPARALRDSSQLVDPIGATLRSQRPPGPEAARHFHTLLRSGAAQAAGSMPRAAQSCRAAEATSCCRRCAAAAVLPPGGWPPTALMKPGLGGRLAHTQDYLQTYDQYSWTRDSSTS